MTELSPVEKATEMLRQANAEPEVETEAPEVEETEAVEPETKEPEKPVKTVKTEAKEVEETEDTEEEVAEDDPFAPKFAALSRREKKVRQLEQEIKDRQEQIKKWEEQQDLIKSDPLKFIESVGLSFEELSNRYVYGNEKVDNSPDKKMSDLELRLAKFEQQEQERIAREEAARQQEIVDNFMTELNEFIDKSDFELIKATESQQLIVDTMVQHWNETGEEMPKEQAAELVENYLEEQETKKLEKVLKLDKIKKKLALVSDESEESQDEEQAEVAKAEPKKKVTKKTKTLSNSATSAAPKREKLDDNEEARRARAEAILRDANKRK